MRRLNVFAFSLMAPALMAIAAASPAAADGNDASTTPRFFSVHRPSGVAPNSAYQGLAATNVTVGVETEGVPCANCVSGAGTPNLGIAWPVFLVSPRSALTITHLWESTSYTGPCTAELILKQGATVVYSTSFAFPGGCVAGELYGVSFPVTAPRTTGFTVVIGSVHGGSNVSGADSFINIQ
jgi:hypothetical protein